MERPNPLVQFFFGFLFSRGFVVGFDSGGNAKKDVFPAEDWSRETGPVSGSAELQFHESLPHQAYSILRPLFPLG